jgi:hypothetical protein
MSNKLPIGQQRRSKIRTAILVVASTLFGTVLRAQAEDSAKTPSIGEIELPPEVALALNVPNKAILYSLEPWEEAAPTESTLHGFKVIGQLDLDRDLAKAVAAQFKVAIASQDGPSAGCFDPRHALTVTSGGTTYDFLLCYACGELEVFSGKRMVADFRALGTGEVLNAILSANKVPLSRSAMELQDSRDQKIPSGTSPVYHDRFVASKKPSRPPARLLQDQRPYARNIGGPMPVSAPQTETRLAQLWRRVTLAFRSHAPCAAGRGCHARTVPTQSQIS